LLVFIRPENRFQNQYFRFSIARNLSAANSTRFAVLFHPPFFKEYTPFLLQMLRFLSLITLPHSAPFSALFDYPKSISSALPAPTAKPFAAQPTSHKSSVFCLLLNTYSI
jgi:hypothetical protein